MNQTVRTTTSTTFLSLLLFFIALLVVGCSSLFPSRGTPESKLAVLRVTNEYLTAFLSGKTDKLSEYVVWPEYYDNTKIPRDLVLARADNARKTKIPAEHPLAGLTPLSVEIKNDDGEVQLRKNDGPILKIKLHWTGGGWMVVGDNIFVSGGVLGQ